MAPKGLMSSLLPLAQEGRTYMLDQHGCESKVIFTRDGATDVFGVHLVHHHFNGNTEIVMLGKA
jgi:hypothetical protein